MKSNYKHKKHKLESNSLLGVNITVTPKDQLLDWISSSLKKNVQLFITTPNPEILVKASKNSKYKDILNQSDIALPDGFGISLASNFIYGKSLKRIKGREFLFDLLDIANKDSYKVFLLGSSPHVQSKAIKKINKLYPNIKLRGSADIKVNIKSNFEVDNNIKSYKDIINSINKFNPHMVLIFLGAPKQEVWAHEFRKKIDTKLLASLGGSLDYFVGDQVLPPAVVSRLGLEWIWRLFFQPARIFRIFNAVFVFPLLILFNKLKPVDNKSN